MAQIRGLAAATQARNELLEDWLRSHHAMCNWQQRVPRCGILECWQANGRIFLVQRYDRDAGWEVFVPAHKGIKTMDTLAAASQYIRAEE